MNYKDVLSEIKLSEEEAQELISYGSEVLDYAFMVYKNYKRDGKIKTTPFRFLQIICHNYLEKKRSSGAQFNQSFEANKQGGSDDDRSSQVPKQRYIEPFVWREGLLSPEELWQEDKRFEEWLLTPDGGEYLRRSGLKDIPESFKVFARDVLRYNAQMRQLKRDEEALERGASVIGAIKEVRPIAPRMPASFDGYELSDDEKVKLHWQLVIDNHLPCILKSKGVTLEYLTPFLRDYAYKACEIYAKTHTPEEILSNLFNSCKL